MNKWADLGVRTASALVLAPIVVAAIWAGDIWFLVFVIFAGVMLALEWITIAHSANTRQFALHALAVICATVLVKDLGVLRTCGVIAILTAMSIAVSLQAMNKWKLIGVPYVALPILALVVLRSDAQWGLAAILWCVVIVWSADILAYFAGRIIGGPKLAPVLSPKKTWAGMGGAIVGAAAASIVFTQFMNLPTWPLFVFAAVFAVVEQGGDILESALKRSYGVKDSSNLIPGHGGILDRVDGLIAVILAATLVGYLHNAQSAAEGLLRW
jgi:phosphatidate cytidylyltransferase